MNILIIGKKFSELCDYLAEHGHEYLVLRDVKTMKDSSKKLKHQVLCDFSSRESIVEAVRNLETKPDALMAVYEKRYEVLLNVKIGNQEYITPFTLANRQKKIYPILLGRKSLNKRFIVDVDQCGIDRNALKKLYKINLPKDEEQEDD